jgi:hypothetical protein
LLCTIDASGKRAYRIADIVLAIVPDESAGLKKLAATACHDGAPIFSKSAVYLKDRDLFQAAFCWFYVAALGRCAMPSVDLVKCPAHYTWV